MKPELSSNIIPFPSTAQKADDQQPQRGKMKMRLYAFSLDLVLIGLLQKIIVLSYINFIKLAFVQAPPQTMSYLLGNLKEMRLPTLFFTFFSYFLTSLYFGHGKTPGKVFFKLKVCGADHHPHELSFKESLMRTLGYTLCYGTGSLLFFLPFLRKDGRGFPDFFSQTVVLTDHEYETILAQEAINRQKHTLMTTAPTPRPEILKMTGTESEKQLCLFYPFKNVK